MEIPTESEQNDFKKSLVKKIEQFVTKNSILDFVIPIEKVTGFEVFVGKKDDTKYRFSVMCPECDVKIPCTRSRNKHWEVSNFFKHLNQQHSQSSSETTQQSSTSKQNQVNETNGSDIIHKRNAGNLNEVYSLISNENTSANIENPMFIPLSDSLKEALNISK